jgi:ketosteroid isomerase-like protein
MSDTGTSAIKQQAEQFFTTLSTGDLEALRPWFDAESRWVVCAADVPGEEGAQGQGIVDDFLGPVRGLFEPGDPKVHVLAMVAEGDRVVVEGEGRGMLANGREYHNRYTYWLTFDGPILRELREYMDTAYIQKVLAD